MSFNLDHTDRRKIIDAIMSDVPDPGYLEELTTMVQAAAYNAMPAVVKHVYDDADLRPYLRQDRIFFGGGIAVLVYAAPGFRPSAADMRLMNILARKERAALNERVALHDMLQDELAAIMTYDALVVWAGDRFKKYLAVVNRPHRRKAVTKLTPDLDTQLRSVGFPVSTAPLAVADTKKDRRKRKAAKAEKLMVPLS